jgi:succinate-semialdehyde dehydrogenase / glutarate-semialdehyde dehydrogenase
VTLEIDKLIRHSRAEMHLVVRILEYYAHHGPGQIADESLSVDEGSAKIVNAPLCVLLDVQSWNFPVYQVVRFAAPNLVLGNTILLKHASNTPQPALALEQIFADAGAPEGVYTNLFVAGRQVGRIIDNPLVRGVSLTGSDQAGAKRRRDCRPQCEEEREGSSGRCSTSNPRDPGPAYSSREDGIERERR